MIKKLLAILVSMLFIAMVPSTLGDDCEPEQEDEIIFMRGLIFHKLHKVGVNLCYAIHLIVWYKTSEGLRRDVYWNEHFILPDSIYLCRMYKIGLGLFTYYFGFVWGVLEVIE